MVILGIDPGFGRVGYGIIKKESSSLIPLCYGTIETSPKLEFNQRIFEIHNELSNIIKKHEPTVLSIEKLFYGTNVKTAIDVSQARGSIILTCKLLGLEIFEFTPSEIKSALTSNGKADKNQVEYMVKIILGLKDGELKLDDTSDALAAAITLANSL